MSDQMPNWPHAPAHLLLQQGIYMVTAGTYQKLHHFRGADRLDLLQNTLLSCAEEFGWQLLAWAVFANHYHFVGISPSDSSEIKKFLQKLHSNTGREINRLDAMPERKVWYQYWDTRLSYQNSYLARLNYVMQNPVRHQLVDNAKDYKWCSANWFEKNVPSPFAKSVQRFKVDTINVVDAFD